MGFRTTFVTEDIAVCWPAWFKEKYATSIVFDAQRGQLASRGEFKLYGAWENLEGDIQKAIEWLPSDPPPFVIIFLHECGGVSRCEITKDKIVWTEPTDWRIVPGPTHASCYGCSDADNFNTTPEAAA